MNDDEEAQDGTIVCWLPASATEPPLWHMRHDDGDAEDLHSTDLARLLLSDREQDEEDLLVEEVIAAMAAGDAGCESDIPVGRHTASERHNGVAMRGARLIFRFDAPVGWVLGTILRRAAKGEVSDAGQW